MADAAGGGAQAFDLFISHDWAGADGRNHERVKRVSHALAASGWCLWLDEQQMEGNIDRAMCQGIDASRAVLVFVTRRYQDKVNGTADDNCQREFDYAIARKWGRVIPVVMDADMRDQMRAWEGPFLMGLRRELYFDLSDIDAQDPDQFAETVAKLGDFIQRKLDMEEADPSVHPKGVPAKAVAAGMGAAASHPVVMAVAAPTAIPAGSSGPSPAGSPQHAVSAFALGFDPLAVPTYNARAYVPGTRQWIFDRLDGWRASKSRCFVLMATAGAGKSVFLGELCRRLGALPNLAAAAADGAAAGGAEKRKSWLPARISRRGSQAPLGVGAVHFFKVDDRRSSNPRLAMVSVAQQLARVLGGGFLAELEKVDTSVIDNEDLAGLFQRLISEPCAAVSPAPRGQVAVVIDALDECDTKLRKEFLSMLQLQWLQRTPSWLVLIMSTRPDDYIPFKLREFAPFELNCEDESNMEDIRAYFRLRLEPCFQGSAQDLDAATQIMLDRSQGLFLYARFMEDILTKFESVTLRDVQQEDSFPAGLNGIYTQYFARLKNQAFAGDTATYECIIGTLMVARAPVPIETMASILSFATGVNARTARSGVRKSNQLLLTNNETLRFVHKSCLDWLLDDANPEDDLLVDLESAHALVGEWARSNRSDPFAFEHAVYHLSQAGKLEECAAMLTEFTWLQTALLKGIEVYALVRDCEKYFMPSTSSHAAVTVVRALEKSNFAIEQDPLLLACQLIGRIPDRSHPVLQSLAAEFRPRQPWLEPVRPTLIAADSALRKTLHLAWNALATALDLNEEVLVCGCVDNCLRVYNVSDAQLALVLKPSDDGKVVEGKGAAAATPHSEPISDVCILPGHMVAAASQDCTIRLYSLKDGKEQHVFRFDDWVIALAVSGHLLYSGHRDGLVRVIDLTASKMAPRELKGSKHDDWVNQLSASAVGGVVATSSHDGSCKWFRDGKLKGTIRDGPNVTAVAVSLDGRYLATASVDMTLRIYAVGKKQAKLVAETQEAHRRFVFQMTFTEDNELLSCGEDKVMSITTVGGKVVHRVREHTDWMGDVACVGRQVVTCSRDRTVRFWDLSALEAAVGDIGSPAAADGHSREVRGVYLGRQPGTVVSVSFDRTMKTWELASGALLRTETESQAGVAGLTQTNELGVACERTQVLLPGWRHSAALGFCTDFNIMQGAYMSTGQHVVVGDASGLVHILRLRTPTSR